MRPIDADALELRIAEFEAFTGIRLDAVHDFVSSEPTVDAVPVIHGKWIADESTYTDGFVQCSVCKTTYFADDLYWVGEKAHSELPNYCPHCGAKMDAERKEE